MYNELNFSEIRAKGWIKDYLETQAKGLTGNIGKVGKPFSLECWEQKGNPTRKEDENFVGGINSKDDSWVPFEQNGYWIDGAIRAGRLIDNPQLISLVSGKIYKALELADDDGFIGPNFLKDNISWPYAVYFRALIAEYTATGNNEILEKLKKHFLRRPLVEVYKNVDWRIIAVRNVADIETALFIYGQTGDQRFLQMSEDSYAEFNRIFSDDTDADENSKMFDVTLKGMLANGKANNNHGVTYCELCKLGAILYKYTGKEIYKKASVKAFDKLYRDNMLIDGVHSSTEYLNGNKDSLAMHETCDVSDLTWALGYLYMVTGDTKYSDWVENAVFNAGLGSVDDDFKGNQYFSCPNQVIANDNCNHVVFFRGREWMSYAPKSFLACCAGNVHRFMPNYVARAWMKDKNTLSAFVYAPCEIDVCLDNGKVKITEETEYPFENTVRFKVCVEKPIEFTLALRKPCWAVTATLKINGKIMENCFVENQSKLTRTFNDGDLITLEFTDKIEFIENAKGVSVKKGALLYALPVKERQVIEGLRELNNPDFPHYSLYPESKWNYGLCVNETPTFNDGKVSSECWKRQNNGLRIRVFVQEVKDWKLKKVKKYLTRFKPRAKCEWEEKQTCFMPKVKKVDLTKLGEKQVVELVPYCTTRLRVAIFPLIKGE